MARIMVVDDAEFARMKVSRLLVENGHEVIEASDGQDALDKYEMHKPDLVLMDITMPVMDGITAVKEIISRDPGAKIVMCSALGQQAMVIESIKSGAKDFVVKPWQPEKVLATIKKLVG